MGFRNFNGDTGHNSLSAQQVDDECVDVRYNMNIVPHIMQYCKNLKRRIRNARVVGSVPH